jgi:hypothetical protein
VTIQQRPEKPRAGVRGFSSWLNDFYASSGPYVAVWARVQTIFWSAVAGVLTVLVPLNPSWNMAVAAGLGWLLMTLHGWVGFFYLANPEWSNDGDDA